MRERERERARESLLGTYFHTGGTRRVPGDNRKRGRACARGREAESERGRGREGGREGGRQRWGDGVCGSLHVSFLKKKARERAGLLMFVNCYYSFLLHNPNKMPSKRFKAGGLLGA